MRAPKRTTRVLVSNTGEVLVLSDDLPVPGAAVRDEDGVWTSGVVGADDLRDRYRMISGVTAVRLAAEARVALADKRAEGGI